MVGSSELASVIVFAKEGHRSMTVVSPAAGAAETMQMGDKRSILGGEREPGKGRDSRPSPRAAVAALLAVVKPSDVLRYETPHRSRSIPSRLSGAPANSAQRSRLYACRPRPQWSIAGSFPTRIPDRQSRRWPVATAHRYPGVSPHQA